MTNEKQLVDHLKRMTTDLRSAHHRIPRWEDARSEPIAIVGTAYRYPCGVTTRWEPVRDGRDAVSAGRGGDVAGRHARSDRRGTVATAENAFLDDAGGRGSWLSGLSPREAPAVDP